MPPNKKLYSLTDEHRAQLEPWADKWIANAMSTVAMTEEDRAVVKDAVLGLYAAANLPAPRAVVFCSSPISGAIATGIAAGIWFLREHTEKHQELFGSAVSELEMVAAISPAAELAVRAGMRQLETLQSTQPIAVPPKIRAATDAATADATDAALIRFLIACGNGACWRMRNGGNQWSAWVSYLSFFRHVAKLDIDYSKYAHWETCAERSGPRYMHRSFVIVCDRPQVIKIDERNRPHCADGPSHRWLDGWELYHWRGLRVPKTWISDAKNLDPTTALTWHNIEQRRAAAEIIGWKRVLEQLSPKVINKHKDPEIGELLEVELPEAGTARFLKVRCGTGRDFVLSVPREMKTALEANAWTYDLKPKEYKLEART